MNYKCMNNIRIMGALLRRDLYIFKSTLLSTMIDAGITLFTEIILNVKLLPLIGMPRELIAPLYIGSIISKLFFITHSNSMRIQYGIKNEGIELYEATLPLSKSWLFARNIIRFIIETLIILVPLTIASIPLIGSDFQLISPCWPLALFFALMAALFFATLSLFIAHHYSFEWYMDNVWPRRLSVLFMTSVIFVTWKKAMYYIPWFGYLALLNPTTYFIEGLRSSLFDPTLYLSSTVCMVGSLFFAGLMIIITHKSIIKRLDLV